MSNPSIYDVYEVYGKGVKSWALTIVDFYNEGFYKIYGSRKYAIYYHESSKEILEKDFNYSFWRNTANVICTVIVPVLFFTLLYKTFSKENRDLHAKTYWLQNDSTINRPRPSTTNAVPAFPGQPKLVESSLVSRIGNAATYLCKRGADNFVRNANTALYAAESVAKYVGLGDGNSVKAFIANKLTKILILGAGSSLADPALISEAVGIERIN